MIRNISIKGISKIYAKIFFGMDESFRNSLYIFERRFVPDLE